MKNSKKHRLRLTLQGRPNKAEQAQPPSARARRLQNLRVLPHLIQRTPQACLHPSTFEINQFDIHYSFHPPSCPSLPPVSQATQASQGDEVAGAKQIGPEGARSERAQAVLLHRVLPRNTRQAAQRTVCSSLFFILLSCQKKLLSVSSVPSVANFFLSVNSCRFVAKKIN